MMAGSKDSAANMPRLVAPESKALGNGCVNCPEEVACSEADPSRRALGGLAHSLDFIGWQGQARLRSGCGPIMYIVAQVKHKCLPPSREPFCGDQAYPFAPLLANLPKSELVCLSELLSVSHQTAVGVMSTGEFLILGSYEVLGLVVMYFMCHGAEEGRLIRIDEDRSRFG